MKTLPMIKTISGDVRAAFCAVAIVATALCASADPFTYVDHWPSGTAPETATEVVVPDNTTATISTTEDVTRVARLTAISLGTGATVTYDSSTALTLSAALSGYGTFECVDSAGIVLSGDNSQLVSPGTFFFTNTSVIVSNRYGLGSTGTAMVKYCYGDKNGNGLLFRGPGLVVDAPITIQATNIAQRVVGPESVGDTLVFSNSFRIAGHNPDMKFRNKVRFAGGTFGPVAGTGSGGHLYTYKQGSYAEVWFDSGVKPTFDFWFAADIVYHLGWDDVAGCTLALSYLDSVAFICENRDLFAKFSSGIGSGNSFVGSEKIIDLNGYDQTVKCLNRTYNASSSLGIVVTSAVPATVTLKSTSDDWCKGNFQGAAALTYEGTKVNEFRTMFSATTGPLTIKTGTFKLSEGAGWGGTNVLIKSGAELSVDSASMPVAFGNRALQGHQSRTKLEIESGGSLELAASAEPAVVRTLVYDGTIMPAGLYTKTSGVGITGDGALRVSTNGKPGLMLIFR